MAAAVHAFLPQRPGAGSGCGDGGCRGREPSRGALVRALPRPEPVHGRRSPRPAVGLVLLFPNRCRTLVTIRPGDAAIGRCLSLGGQSCPGARTCGRRRARGASLAAAPCGSLAGQVTVSPRTRQRSHRPLVHHTVTPRQTERTPTDGQARAYIRVTWWRRSSSPASAQIAARASGRLRTGGIAAVVGRPPAPGIAAVRAGHRAPQPSLNHTVRPMTSPVTPQASDRALTIRSPCPPSPSAALPLPPMRSRGAVCLPWSCTPTRTQTRSHTSTRSVNVPPGSPLWECRIALTANSSAIRTASPAAGQPPSTRATNVRTWPICSGRPG
jgi:hypothetical protein